MSSDLLAQPAEIAYTAIGTIRLYVLPTGEGKLGRLAVLPSGRGKKVGAKLVQAVEDDAKSRGVPKIKLHAQYDKR
jgi:predicted N-acetyltransferase YhbS